VETVTERRANQKPNPLGKIRLTFRNRFLPPNDSNLDQLAYWRERILFAILGTGLLLGFFGLLAFLSVAIREKLFTLGTLYVVLYVGAVAIALHRSITYEIRASAVLLICYVIGLAILFHLGPLSGGPLWIFASSVLAGVLLGLKAAITALIGNGIILSLLCFWISKGWFGRNYEFFTLERSGAAAASFMILNALAAVSVALLVRGLQATAEKERKANAIASSERRQLIRAEEKLTKELLERKHTEEELRRSEERYRDIFQNVSDFIYMHDLEGKFIETNRPFINEMGYSEADLSNLHVSDLLPERYKKDFEDYRKKILAKGRDEGLMKVLTKDGHERIIEYRNSLIRGAEGPIGVRGSARDITDGIKAQEALKASEEKYRRILQTIEEGYYEVDTAGNHTFFNDSLCRIYGYSSEEMLDANFRKLNDKEGAQQLYKAYRKIYETGEPIKAFDWQIIRKDGSKRHVEASASLMKDGRGKPIGFRGMVRDVTEHKIAEKALEEEKERFQILVEESPFGVSLIGKEGQYNYLNSRFTEIFGYTLHDIPTGKEWFLKAYPDAQERKHVVSNWISDQESAKTVNVNLRTFAVMCKDGTEKVINFRPVTMHTGEQFIIYEDVTEQKRLESQLRQAQKMEAIGTLAGGIAHDFNNILSAIIGYTEILILELSPDSPANKRTEAVLNAALRAKDLVKQILAFSRQSAQERLPLQALPLVKESVKMLRATLPSTIEIHQNVGKDLRIIEADPTQFQQVLMNLCTNAAHAMSEDGGRLEIGLSNADIDDKTLSQYRDLKRGRYLRLTVSDTGAGMRPEVLSRVFEPYFTTKEKGSGTGLGMAVVHGIVKSYGGSVTVYSELGTGSTINVYFPACEQMEIEAEVVAEILPKGRERILFVDDEQALTDIGQQMLEHLGYEVTARTSSVEALELFRTKPDAFDLVITDMTMPNITGDVLAKEIIGLRPDISIILCTGYSQRITTETAKELGIRGFVMKPVAMKDLATTIRRTLDQSTAAGHPR
jgi:PAS domain S-box-containing protein